MQIVFFKKNLIILSLSVLFVISCTSVQKSPTPEWVFGNTGYNSICYVGSSRPHIRGLPYQRALAVSRAIEGIARQKNVTVDTSVEHYMTGTSESSISKVRTYSTQTTTGEKISAEIKETWLSKQTNELFILMCEE